MRYYLACASVILVSMFGHRITAQEEGDHATKQAEVTDAAEVTALDSRAKEDADTHAGETDAHHASLDDQSHSGGEHHDPHDLSHANASEALEDPGEFKSDLAIWTFVVFLCLLAVLTKFAWGPIMGGLEKRESSIAAMIDDAKQSQEKAAEQLRQYEARLASASDEARELVAQARKEAEAAGERIVAEAQQVSERERQRAVADINTAKGVALQEITDKSVDIAVALASRIVRRELKADDHAQLVREALDKLPPSRN